MPQVTMQSSPTDMALLAENQLFQAYQVVYYNEQTSNNSSNNSANPNPSDGQTPGGQFTGRGGDNSNNKPYAMKSSKVPHKPIE